MSAMAGKRSTKENLQQLIQAVTADELKKVESLLAAGADVNARDDRGLTALMHARARRSARKSSCYWKTPKPWSTRNSKLS
jgi:ankyrin repeat protein